MRKLKMEKNENKKNCFVMMPFSTPQGYEEGHFQKIYDQIIMPAVKDAGFEPVRVDKNILSTDIVTKIFQGLTECDMAICDLSSRNPNVLYELGIRQAYNKPVLLIKDEKTEHIFDVGGLTTLPYNSNRLYENVVDAVDRISKALKEHDANSENVINIIKGRLAFLEVANIENPKDMSLGGDNFISLMTSLVSDVGLIKQRLNRASIDENFEYNFMCCILDIIDKNFERNVCSKEEMMGQLSLINTLVASRLSGALAEEMEMNVKSIVYKYYKNPIKDFFDE